MLSESQEAYINSIPSEKIVRIVPWHPHLQEVAGRIVAEVLAVVPEVAPCFLGSAALQIAGEGDVDLDWHYRGSKRSEVQLRLSNLLGPPTKPGPTSSGWEFLRDGVPVDSWLVSPDEHTVHDQLCVFEALRSNSTLLNQYERLKLRCDGISYRDYQRLKYEFFFEIIAGARN